MISGKYINRLMIISIVFFVNPIFGMEKSPVRDKIPEGWGGKAVRIAGKPFSVISDNSEWFNLAGSLMQAPYIFTIDSTDQKTIKICASLAAASTGLKIVSIASGNGPFMKMLMWDVPKILCYFLSASYDTIRILDAPKVVLKNNTDAKRLKFFKFTQLLQLSIEIVLRGMAIMSKNEESFLPKKVELVATFATELADIVSIWRLLERYKTYFISEIDMLEFNFGWKKSPASGIIEIDDEIEIEKLEALAEAFAKEQCESRNTPQAEEEGPVINEVA